MVGPSSSWHCTLIPRIEYQPSSSSRQIGRSAFVSQSPHDLPFCGCVRFPGTRSSALNRPRYQAPGGSSFFGGFFPATGSQQNTHTPKMGNIEQPLNGPRPGQREPSGPTGEPPHFTLPSFRRSPYLVGFRGHILNWVFVRGGPCRSTAPRTPKDLTRPLLVQAEIKEPPNGSDRKLSGRR
jgi:hypothetical protein